MSTTPIERPLHGERVVALSPENANAAATDWLRRPNLFAGRALTAPTLEGRQRWQAGRIAIRGQAYTPGVVTGLGVGFAIEGGRARLTIAAGRGLAVSGEDVALPRALELDLLDLPVVAEPAVFVEAGEPRPDVVPPEGAGPGALRPRVIGAARLGALIAVRPDILPAAGVLVLQPVTVDRFDFDPTDPCDRHPCAEPGAEASPESFEDARTADAARVLWYAWPDEWRALPAAGPRRRNALAHVIFDAEAGLAEGAALPWEPWGVPVALIGVDASWRPLFADRAAVVRWGGRARDARLVAGRGARLGTSTRAPGLWQARIEQLAEQLAEMGDPAPPAASLAASFGRLPPVGLLPANVVNLAALPLGAASAVPRSEFFPAGFELDAVPVPIEQLDVAIREAAPLAALDLSARERVRVLVPVTQASFEPRLLREEAVAPEFEQTLARFLLERARALGARQALRAKLSALAATVGGRALPVPGIAEDPLALEPESLLPWGPPPAGGGHRARLAPGLHQHFFDGATETLTLVNAQALFVWAYLDPDHPPRTLMIQWHSGGTWEHRAYWGENLIAVGQNETISRRRIDDLPPLGRWVRLEVPPGAVGLAPGAPVDGIAFTLFDGRAAYGPSGFRSTSAVGDQPWFSRVLPVGARAQGDYPWELLTDTDLGAPFEPGFGLVAPGPAGVPAGGGHVEPAARGVHQHFFQSATPPLAVTAADALFVWVWLDPANPPRTVMIQWHVAGVWEHRAFWGENLVNFGADATPARRRVAGLPALGTWVRLAVPAASVGAAGAIDGVAFTLFDGGAAFGAAGRIDAGGTEIAWFSGALPAGAAPSGVWSFLAPRDMPAPLGAPLTGTVAAIAALHADPALAALSGHERGQLAARGLAGFIAYLTSRADRADDLVDYGFVKVQTDVYRLRQLVLGTTAATRLAISPALASIAKAETAVASQERITSFFDELRRQPSARAPVGDAGRAPTTAAAFEVGTVTRSTRSAIADAPAGAARERRALEAAAPVPVARRVEDAGTLVRARTEAISVIAPFRTTTAEVVQAAPIVGKATVRTTAIAQRLEDPKAIEAKDYAAATRHEAVTALVRLADDLRDEDQGVTPGLFEGIDVYGVRDDPFLGAQNQTRRVALTEFVANRALIVQLLTTPTRTRPVPNSQESTPDEGAYFSDSADLSDNTVVLIRQVEGRIHVYRTAIALAERTLAALRAEAEGAQARLAAVGETLAEARHDVSVARALLAEETERVAGINRRRRDVIAQEVRFLAFARPRETDSLSAAPLRALDPGLIEPPVPACLREHQDVPDELADMLRVVREAPAGWFTAGRPLLDRLDHPELLARVVETAQLRTQLLGARAVAAAPAAAPATRLAAAISSVRQAQLQVVSGVRAVAARIDVSRVRDLTWRGAREQAEPVVSLGDLIDGEHGRGEVARRAAEAFEQVSRVAACLHAELSMVPPSIRLDWAELFSEFDEAPNLRNLGRLPRWAEVPHVDRRQMQSYADWLFSRIDPGEARAEALVNDVIRMCLLLASHAPVDRIVAGRLARPVTARPGARIALTAFEPARLRLGMQAVVYRGVEVVARALVEDIGTTEVSARVIQTSAAQVDLDIDARVQFARAEQVSLAPSRRGPRAGR